MPYHALLEYIRTAKDCGASDVEILERLHAAGWYAVDAQDALELYRKLTANTHRTVCVPEEDPPKPSFIERIAPRHYDPHLIAVAAVSFVIGFLAYVWISAK